ncbi:MAG: response regulator [Desulfobacteraceae bacterium]|nr:response regulator [Desulfobacteraceae bacterium]
MKETIKILCVDDEKNVLRALARLFMDDDYQLLTAANGEEALAILRREPGIQLIISDYRMPGMDGVDFLRQVNESWPKTIRIVLSGFADIASVVGAINEGQIYKFIPKPWNDEELKVTIAKALEVYFLRQKNETLSDELMEAYLKLESINANLEEEVRSRTETLIFQNEVMQFTHQVMDALPAAVLGLDMSGLIVLANQEADRLLAAGRPTLTGMDGTQVLPQGLLDFILQAKEHKRLRVTMALSGEDYQVIGGRLAADHRQEGVIVMCVPC